MSDNRHNSDEKNKTTDEAWNRIRSKLADEPAHPRWQSWNHELKRDHESLHGQVSGQPDSNEDHDQAFSQSMSEEDSFDQLSVPKVRRTSSFTVSGRKKRNRKWAGLAAAGLLFGVILATPTGNNALAAILGQFRVQEVAVVQEEDVRAIYNEFRGPGQMQESITKYGVLKTDHGSLTGEFTSLEAEKKLGYKIGPKDAKLLTDKVNINASSTFTFNLNVKEVNEVMQRLGAKKLLPESVDGKEIKVYFPESVFIHLPADKDGSASLTQQNVPVVTVDPSLKLEEAVEAIIQFPLMPDYLKNSLKQNQILSGTIPMPLVSNQNTEKIMIHNTPVTLQLKGQNDFFQATWIKDGQLFNFQGRGFLSEREQLVNKLKELIPS
ncbi:hypothetical protein [Paenibacillus lutrae]|uniref:DUF4367 domain-containing protein n=1 Tax=Paenibacillus lutrae TaxID=2078573 RepID=A0A7X3FEF1_9BACL|nr:hypothetical protein [Paenibacillus lutrae]MVO98109.1 hypothetical protein [Paenibacillus lutrae]